MTLQLRMWPKGKRYGGGCYGASKGYNKWGIEYLKQLNKAGKIRIKLKPTQLCIKNTAMYGENVLTNIDAELEAYLRKQVIWPEDGVMEVRPGENGGYKPSKKSGLDKFNRTVAANANQAGATTPATKKSPPAASPSPLGG